MKGSTNVMTSPTAQQLFGPEPWVTDPPPGGNSNFGPYLYSKYYFATLATAQLLCRIIELGAKLAPGTCKVVAVNDITGAGGPFGQNQPNQMIQLPNESITPRNAGIMAKFFQDTASMDMVNQLFTAEIGQPFTFVMPPAPAAPVLKPTPGVELLVAAIGGTAMQADGTTWQRLT